MKSILIAPSFRPLIVAAGITLIAAGDELSAQLDLTLIGRYQQPDPNAFDVAAAEISAYDPVSSRLFVTNDFTSSVDIIDISDPTAPTLVHSADLSTFGSPTSVAVRNELVAVAVKADPNTDTGHIVFLNTAGAVLNAVHAGAHPDAVAFTADGNKVLCANEGEPNSDYSIDTEGSVSIVDVSGGVLLLTDADVEHATFSAWIGQENALRSAGIRIYGPFANAAQDLEPEFVVSSPDSTTAYVTLQENNALAVVDIASATVTNLVSLGIKNHQVDGSGLDPSDRDGGIHIGKWRVGGMYLPDAVAAYSVAGKTYLLTANEGDARAYDGFSEEIRGNDLPDEGFHIDGQGLLKDEKLGRLRTTTFPPTPGLKLRKDGTIVLDRIFAYGARSFSIWDAGTGKQVFDSGDDFEQLTAALVPDIFNSNNTETKADGRSDDKGPEPEGITLGSLGGKTYAFISFERTGGVVVYDVTNPNGPAFVTYTNNRMAADEEGAGTTVEDDLGPESMVFISADDSPTGIPLLVVANEVSGSVLVYEITE
jgi:DNA-binding beta-propeller fold protein YncE